MIAMPLVAKTPMETERTVVTGLGTVNAVAASAAEFLTALETGTCGIGPLTLFDTAEFKVHIAGEVASFKPATLLPQGVSLKRTSRADQLALCAGLEALQDAGLYPLPESLRPDTGIVIGGGAGGMLEAEAVFGRSARGLSIGDRYSRFASFCCAATSDHLSAHLKTYGPKTTFMTACSSGATAIGYARDLIAAGASPVVLCGGTEALSRVTFGAFNAINAVDRDPCRPFDRNRQGLSLGEGAGMLVLEAGSHALARGAKIYAEVCGYGLSADAHHMTAPAPAGGGAVDSMRAALADAGLSPGAIDYVNAHGTATPANDLMETQAIKSVFGDHAYRLAVSSIKAMTGHSLAAAGAVEAVAVALSLHHRFLPPTVHLTTPDPDCDLDYVSEGARPAALRYTLSNSFAFGGNNTSLIFGAPAGGRRRSVRGVP
jgi:3-oxoacyl-[acyl-carrier-protein] synthase II